ncbi:hypothetical protein VNO80_21626 [Phaseolus coccineus]|uniref:Uncharacterized protein n=1 Tax=Phaseolus coccineus TaxID=3886 RepID=A0AAN9M3L3_PHACN
MSPGRVGKQILSINPIICTSMAFSVPFQLREAFALHTYNNGKLWQQPLPMLVMLTAELYADDQPNQAYIVCRLFSLSLSGLSYTTLLSLSLSLSLPPIRLLQLQRNFVLTVDRALVFVPKKLLLYLRFFFFFLNFIRFACCKIL